MARAAGFGESSGDDSGGVAPEAASLASVDRSAASVHHERTCLTSTLRIQRLDLKEKMPSEDDIFSYGSGGWIRTSDPLINSQPLYR